MVVGVSKDSHGEFAGDEVTASAVGVLTSRLQ